MKRLLIPFLLSLMLMFVGCTKEGPTGPMGLQGPVGEEGEQGEVGDQGETGEQGDTGDTGNTGDQGDQGETGDTGEQGDQGDTGETGETGDQGEIGPEGPEGPEGPPGISLIAEYTGTLPSDGNYSLSVPEIKGKRATTFVMAYWTIPTAPSIWTPMTDGWLDSYKAHIFWVSWTYGKVYFYYMTEGDLYLVQVFQHD